MLKTFHSTSEYWISFPTYDYDAIQNRQANLQNHQHIRMHPKEPLIDLLYQSTKLFNDMKEMERKRTQRDAEAAMVQRHMRNKNARRR